jgi:hypothetical protein
LTDLIEGIVGSTANESEYMVGWEANQWNNEMSASFSVPSNAPPRMSHQLGLQTGTSSSKNGAENAHKERTEDWNSHTTAEDPLLHPAYTLPPIDLDLLNAHLEDMYPSS